MFSSIKDKDDEMTVAENTPLLLHDSRPSSVSSYNTDCNTSTSKASTIGTSPTDSTTDLRAVSELSTCTNGVLFPAHNKDGFPTISKDIDPSPSPSPLPHAHTLKPLHFYAIVVCLVMAQFLSSFDSFIVSSSHTVITSTFSTAHLASWLSTSFMITQCTAEPIYGASSDLFGRRGPFLLALSFFSVGTLGCALAGSMLQLVIARTICGAGAGGIRTLSSIILSDLLPLEQRGLYQSLNIVSYCVGQAAGAGLGGLLAEKLGWRWSFGVQMPACALLMALALVALPRPKHAHHATTRGPIALMRSFDVAGCVQLALTLSLLIVALSFGGSVVEWSSPLVVGCAVGSLVAGALFVRSQFTAAAPLLPPALLSIHPFPQLLCVAMLSTACNSAVMFNLPLYRQAVHLDSPSAAGLALLPAIAACTVGSLVAGWAISFRLAPGCGASLYGGTLVLALGSLAYALRHWAVGLLLWAFGMGAGHAGVLMMLVAFSDRRKGGGGGGGGGDGAHAVPMSMLALMRALGTLAGVSGSGAIVQNGLRVHLAGEKPALVKKVARNVSEIPRLEESVRRRVIMAYSKSMTSTDWFAALCAVGALVLLFVGGWIWVDDHNKAGKDQEDQEDKEEEEEEREDEEEEREVQEEVCYYRRKNGETSIEVGRVSSNEEFW